MYEKLLKEYVQAKRKADAKLRAIHSYDSGYLWLVNICSYGSSSWRSFTNVHGVQELIDEYYDGYDGLLYIYTNDPTAEPLNNCGCVNNFSVLTTQELHDMEQPYKSRTAGLLSFITGK